MMVKSAKNEDIGAVSEACRWVADSLAAAPGMGEAEWGLLHEKVEKFSREFDKMLPLASSEREKIALLQAGHDALYLLSGNVTVSAEQRYLAAAIPVLQSYLDRHERETVTESTPSLLPFLRLSLDLLYSSRFLSAAADTLFADRLTDYTARTLDALRTGVPHPSPQLQSLFALEENLYAEA